VRPYAAKTAGTPLHFEYEMASGAFSYSWIVGSEARETEVFVPERLVRARRIVVEGLRVDEGDTYTYDVARQTLFVLPAAVGGSARRTVCVRVRFDPPVGGEAPNGFWSDFARPVVGVVILAALASYYLR
jgi:hypothetical protein